MKLLFYSALICFFSACNSNETPAIVNAQMSHDTTYVTIDNINKSENTFEYVLYFSSAGHKHEIFREKNRDYSVEFDSIPFKFKNSRLNIEEYKVYDLPTGADKSIIRDKNSNVFYLTDWYNNHAGTDTTMLSLLNFNSDSVKIKSSDAGYYPDYNVKLSKIWGPKKK